MGVLDITRVLSEKKTHTLTDVCWALELSASWAAVPFTPLTLPTNLPVYITVGACYLKTNTKITRDSSAVQ